MSFSFFVTSPSPPALSGLVDRKQFPDLRCEETRGAGLSGSLQPGVCRHYHLPGRSTRGVEVRWLDGRVEVRVMTCSSPEDHELAIRMVERLATKTGGEIDTDDAQVLRVDKLRKTFNDAWIKRQNASDAEIVRVAVEQKGAMQLSGPVRTAHLGRRMLARLAKPGATDFAAGLLQALRDLQWVDEDRWHPATVMNLRPKGDGDDAAVTVCVWGAGIAYLFPPVGWLVLEDDDDMVILPPASVAELTNGRCRWLDEAHLLVEAIPEAAWEAFVDRARRVPTARLL